MAFFIHRRSSGTERPSPRLLLVGGEGRWVLPLLRLTERLGFATFWIERKGDSSNPERLDAQDVVMAADPVAARWVIDQWSAPQRAPIVVITGSLLGLSTAISRDAIALPWPITRETLETALRVVDDPNRKIHRP